MSKFAKKESKFPGLLGNVKNTQIPDHAQAHEHEHEHEHDRVSGIQPKKKELFSKRFPVLMTETMVAELDARAEELGMNRNELIREIVGEYLSKVN